MSQQTQIAILGGDSRFLYSAEKLNEIGYQVNMSLFENADIPKAVHILSADNALQQSNVVILPLPVSKDQTNIYAPYTDKALSLSDFMHKIQRGTTVFCGKPSEESTKILQAKKCTVIDYYANEEFQMKNAVLTAEGTIGILIDKLPISIFGLHCAVTGYGRVGERTAHMLQTLGADVTVFARSSRDRSHAEVNGIKTYHPNDLAMLASSFDCIINTVPASLIGDTVLEKIKSNCLLLELASYPYGIDSSAAAERGISCMRASSLPGKTAPQSAGEIIAETIHSILSEGL